MDFAESETLTTSPEILSKFNSAGLVNSMLHNLWLDFFRHFRTGEYLKGNLDLDCIWTVLGGEKNIPGSTTEKEYIIIEGKLAKAGNLRDAVSIVGFNKIGSNHAKLFFTHKAIILEKALFLRRLQNQQGKGTAYSDPDDDLM